ncbi:MAG: hypothetical protein AAGF23_02130, partial [Acidobacteriota bacterium]
MSIRRPVLLAALGLLTLALATPALAQPGFTKTFTPSVIGPGGHSQLVFTIVNGSGAPVTDLAFTDTFPAAIALATPASASTDCGDFATLTAPDGGGTVTLSGGAVGAGGTCTVTVDVVSSTVGVHVNTSGDLTSSAGNSGPATDNLEVAADRPGFSKSFSPSSISLGERSTLTFAVDNSTTGSLAFFITFRDNLPAGLVIADPANAVTTCPGAILTAEAGGTVIEISSGFLMDGETCTVTVDVTSEGLGSFVNRSGSLTSSPGGAQVSSGFAVAQLDVVEAGPLLASKAFLGDAVNPGGTVELEFTLLNTDRFNAATGVSFTDDLDATLTGLVATGLPLADVCGAGSTLSGTSTVTLTGGTLPSGGSCTFSVSLQVPTGVAAGGYPNVTSPITATIGGSPATGDPARETLFVNDAPTITKTFLTNPVGAGETVQLEFTITNPSATSAATDITFVDPINDFISGVVLVGGAGGGVCGAGSTLTTLPVSGNLVLQLISGQLAPSTSCTFTADLLIPTNLPAGDYVNTTDPISATVDGVTQVGGTTTATLTVAGAPRLSKTFTDSPVAPGDTATLEFTLVHDMGAAADALDIEFTDDLDAALSGLVATGLPLTDVCGVGSSISGTSSLSFPGGTLTPGGSCTFSVTVAVPAGAVPGTYTNTTSNVTATVGGLSTEASGSSAPLTVTGLEFTKEFIDDPLLPGAAGTLRFTISNTSTIDLAGGFFTDNLPSALSGLTASTLPANGFCGAGSTIVGPSFLIATGLELLAGTSCTFDVTVQVPGGAANGSYLNATSNLSFSTPAVVFGVASDALTIDNEILEVSKSFTNDPVAAGGTAALEITILNTSDTETITGITLTDDLDAMLSGAVATGLPQSDACGVGSTLSGTGLVTLTGGNLAPMASCTFLVPVQIPAGAADGTYPNTTSRPAGTSSLGSVSGNAAVDALQVRSLIFSKAFLSNPEPGQTVDLQFQIENPGVTAIGQLAFQDDLDAVIPGLVATGLPQSDICGTGSSLTGPSTLLFTAGSLDPGATCSFTVTLQVPTTATVGLYPNATGDLTAAGLPVAGPATDDLEIIAPASVDATLTKAFQSTPVVRDQAVALQYTVTNSSPFALSAIGFTDDFGAALPGLVAVGLPASNVCGAGSTVSGTGTLTLTGGSLAPGATCQFTVTLDLPATAPVGTVTSTSGTLDFNAAGAPFQNAGATAAFDVALLGFTKAFQSDPMPGMTVDLLFTITNPDPANAIAGLTFTDDLDATLTGLAATGLPQTDVCGVGSSIAGTSTITLTGGTVPAGGSCSFTVTLQVPVKAPVGSYPNTTGDLTAGGAVLGGPATDTLVVVAPGSIDAVLGKAFQSSPVAPGQSVDLQYTVDNLSAVTLMAISFTDDFDAALTGLVATGLPQNDVCGTGSTLTGTSTLTLAGGTLAPGASCTFTVSLDLPAGAAPGTVTSTSGSLDFTANGVAFQNAAAVASFDIEQLGFTKTFLADPVTPGDTVDLEFTITNPDAVNAIPLLTFTDDLDAVVTGLVATGLPATDVCGVGSTLSGTSTLALADGSLAAGGTCTFTVTLQVPIDVVAGAYPNTTGDLLSDGGVVAGPATDDLDIDPPTAVDVSVTKSFLPGVVVRDQIVEVFYTITNSSPFQATDLGFTDDFDAALAGLAATGLPQSDVCGTGSTLSGTGLLTLAGGTLDPGASCSFSVVLDVPPTAPTGTVTSGTGNVTFTAAGGAFSNAGAVASFDVDLLGFTKTFLGNPVEPAQTVDVSFVITNPDSASAVTALTFTDDLDAALAGLEVDSVPADGFCGAGSTATGTGTGLLTVANVTVLEADVCTFQVTLRVPGSAVAGTYPSPTGDLTSGGVQLGLPASDDLVVTAPSTVDVTLDKAFLSSPVLPGG